MAFKPNRDKLNAKFEGYKLAKEPLSCVIQTFESGVRVARLDAQDYSYQHVRTFTLHNHLVADPWDGHSVYWCDREGNIQRASYDVSTPVRKYRLSVVWYCNFLCIMWWAWLWEMMRGNVIA